MHQTTRPSSLSLTRALGTLCLAVAFLGACSQTSSKDSLADARAALGSGKYGDALLAVEAGLVGGPDEVTVWGLELVKLEALARAGQGEATLAQLAKLGAERPNHMPPDQYAATADQLRAAGQGAAAIQALDQGLKRFPEDAPLLEQIEAAKAAPAPGSDELEMLRSLGYVE